jgi:hypothetical protein
MHDEEGLPEGCIRGGGGSQFLSVSLCEAFETGRTLSRARCIKVGRSPGRFFRTCRIPLLPLLWPLRVPQSARET